MHPVYYIKQAYSELIIGHSTFRTTLYCLPVHPYNKYPIDNQTQPLVLCREHWLGVRPPTPKTCVKKSDMLVAWQ